MSVAEQFSAPIPLVDRLRRRGRAAVHGPPTTPRPRSAQPYVLAPGARVPPASVPVPRSARVRMAFREMPPSAVEARVLTALADNPGAGSEALSLVCGWRGKIWHTHLAAICHKRMRWLFEDEDSAAGGLHFLYGVLADYDGETGGFVMRQEAAVALAGLGVIPVAD